MKEILITLGVKIKRTRDQLHIDPYGLHHEELPEELVHSLRASFFCIGPLLAKLGQATIPLPGGCQIGARPIDEHLKGLQALGASINIETGVIKASVNNSNRRLKGAHLT